MVTYLVLLMFLLLLSAFFSGSETAFLSLDRVREAHKPVEPYTTSADHFRFMLGYCQAHNLAYEHAFGTFQDFLKNHPSAPERLRVAAMSGALHARVGRSAEGATRLRRVVEREHLPTCR